MLDVVRSDLLPVPHGFLGRAGGVSTDDYASLNCGLGSPDTLAYVHENRARALAAVAPGRTLVAPYQTHSATCLTVTEPWPDDQRPEADALVTDRSHIALSILTADCAPVLLADMARGIIAAAHAGWKGAFAGVLRETVRSMRALGAADITAAIGPCIQQRSYEVGADFVDPNMEREHPGLFASRYLLRPRKTTQYFFDLQAYIQDELAERGVRVDALSSDTLSQPDRFFSYRRATLAGESGYGRQISIIALD